MPARSRSVFRGLALLGLAALVVQCQWRRPGLATAGVGEAPEKEGVGVKDFLGYPLRVRHQVAVDSGKFTFDGVVQGEDQWGVTLGEKVNGGSSPLAVMQKLDGQPATYAITYDTDKTDFKPKLAPGVDGVRFSATSVEGDSVGSADWHLRVSGQKGNHFSATTEGGKLVYEGAFTHEQPILEGLSALYAVDLKRRAGAKNLAPAWFRHGLGLRYASDLGDFKVTVHQPSPDGPKDDVEFEAIYNGDLAGRPGSPSYSIVASRAPGNNVSYHGRMKVKGPQGVTGGLTVGVKDGKASVSGFSDLSADREVYNGVKLSSSTRVTASPDGAELEPINFKASANLANLIPDLMDAGSELSATARYKLGEDKPDFSAAATLRPKPLGPLSVVAEGRVTEADISGKVSASARVADVDAKYSASKVAGKNVHHIGQAVWPAEPKVDKNGVTLPRFYGRVTQSDMDHEGKPRLQVGMMYDFNAKGAQFTGSSHLFDSGSALVDEDGKPWPNAVYNRAKNSANVLRARVRGGAAEGHQWLQKRQNFGD